MELSPPRDLAAPRARPALLSSPLLLVIAAIAVCFLATTGALPLLGKDEPRYVQIAREMFERGDWVTPILGGQTWFEKPVLLYWMVMASFHVFGVSEWAARLGPAVCGLATVLLVFWAARRAEEKSGASTRGLGLWSLLAMSSSVGLIAFSHAATFDIVLSAAITLSLACFFVAEIEEAPRKRSRLLAGMWAAMGLSLLAKGLVGLILPLGVIALYLILRRDWGGARRLQVLWGLPLALAVSALWYGPVIAQHGRAFVVEFFVQHHFARYLTNKYQHPQPFYYYLPIIALLALPWTAFLLDSLRGLKRDALRSDDAVEKLRTLALAWTIVPVAFFSLSGSKLAGYVLPALPGVILLASLSLSAYARGEGGAGRARATGALLLILGVALAIHARKSGAMTPASTCAVVLPMIGAGLAALFLAPRRVLCACLVAGAMLLSTSILTGVAGVPLAESTGVRGLLRQAQAQGFAGEPLLQMDTLQRTAEFYASGRLLYDGQGEPRVLPDATQVASALRQIPDQAALVLVPVERKGELDDGALQSLPLGDNGDVALLHVSLKTP